MMQDLPKNFDSDSAGHEIPRFYKT